MEKSCWYEKGLRFKCTECGGCCTGGPGYVWVSLEEIEKMAAFLKMPLELFAQTHLRQVGERYALVERRRNGKYDCTFLDGKRCSAYSVRPSQCRTFPWWNENLASEEAWQDLASYCEGVNHTEAPIISREEIDNAREH